MVDATQYALLIASPHPANTLQVVNNDELKAERTKRASVRSTAKRKKKKKGKIGRRRSHKESEKAEGTRSNGKKRWRRGPVCMHLGARKGAQEEGSGTAGAVGMKHGRAMLCGPSWRGEQERPLPVLPLLRESAVLHVTPRFAASESATHGTTAWDDDLFFLESENFWCELPKRDKERDMREDLLD
ncbi:hypothetical protein ACS0PU_008018 [Formica fusca]